MASSDRRLIDVREYPEYAGGHIEGAEWVPLGKLTSVSSKWNPQEALTFVCKTGVRSAQARERLAACGFQDLDVVPGGVEQWRASGKPLLILQRKPWSLERQVRIGAGSMVVVSTLLGYFVSPWFLLWTAMVGAGLVFAGVSNICMMATALGKLPWNRPRRD